MKLKYLLTSSLCLLLVGWASPVLNHTLGDISVSMDKTGRPMGVMSDSAVKDQVTNALKADAQFSADFKNVTVDVKDGVVTLTGTVTDESQKSAIADNVANVPGVKNVVNKLEVK